MSARILPVLACLLPLGGMILSDFRQRRVAVLHLLLFAAAALLSARICFGGALWTVRLATNLPFVALMYGGLWLYLRAIRRRKQAIGLGDLLFLPTLAPFFDLRDFVLFLTAAFLFSLALVFIFRICGRGEVMKSVPLVGTVGVCFWIYLVVLWIH